MSNFISVVDRDGIAVLKLNRPKVNALGASFMNEWAERVEALDADGSRGLVVIAEGKTFCAGLDLVELKDASRDAVVDVVDALYRLSRALFTFRKPLVAALNGHAIAGGAYLALACDRRLMVKGESRFGLTESAIGLALPAHGIPMIEYALTRGVAEELLYAGKTYAADEMLARGVVDRLVEPGDLLEEALQDIRSRTPSLAAYSDIKRRLRTVALARMDAARAEDGEWVEIWFSEEAQRRVAELVARLGR